LECKNHKSINLPQFWAEAQIEASNYAKARGLSVEPPAFVIVKRRNASVEQAWVVQSLEKWIELMPVPQGQITTTEIFIQPQSEEPQPHPAQNVAEKKPKKTRKKKTNGNQAS